MLVSRGRTFDLVLIRLFANKSCYLLENFLLTRPVVAFAVFYALKDHMSNIEDNKELGQMDVDASGGSVNMPSPQKQVVFASRFLACLN